jgi:hypothetical protein
MAPKTLTASPSICDCGDHAWVALNRGFVTIVSPEDVHFLERKWRAGGADGRRRPVRSERHGPKMRTVYLHRLICSDGELTDHQNRNVFDNRRGNLRPTDKGGNARNRGTHKNKVHSDFKGVTLNHKRWCARIRFEGRAIWLGNFDTEIQAAEAYDAAARKHFGAFAAPNFEGEQRVGA